MTVPTDQDLTTLWTDAVALSRQLSNYLHDETPAREVPRLGMIACLLFCFAVLKASDDRTSLEAGADLHAVVDLLAPLLQAIDDANAAAEEPRQ